MVYNFFKKNLSFLAVILLLIIMAIVLINPTPYILATSSGFLVWAKVVLPSLFFFFILTRLLSNLDKTFPVFSPLNKVFDKVFHTGSCGGYVFMMSILSGYPLGAKLTSEFYKEGALTKRQATNLLTLASTSGPMFIIGSIGSVMFNDARFGILLFITHVLSALINAKIFCKKDDVKLPFNFTHSKKSLNEIMFDSIISVTMVGGYIALCFVSLELVFNLPFIQSLPPILTGILKGIVELTNGCLAVQNLGVDIHLAFVILSALLSFGGLSIHLQSYMFFRSCDIKYTYFLKTKITQALISVALSVIFAKIFL